MKKLTLLSAFGLMVTLTSFTNSTPSGDWGPWTSMSCFKGLDFSVKKASYNEYAKKYEWWVKFRNRYNTNASFNCVLKESYVSSAKGTDRVTVRANSEGGSTWFLIAEANYARVFVDKLRFGNDDWGTDYATCDQ